MRRVLCSAVAALLAVAFLSANETATKYGAGVSMSETTAIASLAATPESFLGKKVRVDGVVAAVCENMGCWMQLKDEASGQAVRVKVDDGVIVFPVSAKGRKASAEGVFEKVDTAAEAAHHEEMAKKAATAAEPKAEAPAHDHAAMAKAQAAPAPATYQLKATGAVVY